MGVRKVVAFARRHVWPATAGAIVAIVCSICGVLLSISAWNHGWFIAGYLGVAASGDLFIWGVIVTLALWLPRRRATAA